MKIRYFILSSITIILLVVRLNTTFALNCSNSLPYAFFVVCSLWQPSKGHYAEISGHTVLSYKKVNFVKKIVGTAGDKIEWKGQNLLINGRKLSHSNVQTKTRTGEPLTAIKSQIIPKGYVFVFAPHKRSFDSRYAEFGLVPLSKIQGRAFGMGQR